MNGFGNETKTKLKDELYGQYDWFYNSFWPSIQKSTNEFFNDLFVLKLISVSKNINILFQGDDYFVTKIRIDKQHDVFFRCSSEAIKIILDNILGDSRDFMLSNITELEAKIISSFNDYMYNSIAKFLISPPPKNQKRKNFDMIHLTFFIKDKNSDNGAKIIVSLPCVLLAPQSIQSKNEFFDVTNFKSSKLNVNIKVGTTKFSLKDLKNLEKEDIVIFDESDIHTMTLIYNEYVKEIRVIPNPGITTSAENSIGDNGGHNMDGESFSQNLWDNIQVEMGAEFEKVKITLGELKNIEEGLVVDISSVYDNKVFLKVENKKIAKGELVIVNDRYGVRIDEVFASEKTNTEQLPQSEIPEEHYEEQEETLQTEAEETNENSDEEFDYSDFELDDEDI